MNLTRVTLATASSVLLVATLAACGGGSDAATDTSGAAAQAGGAPNAAQGGAAPGASGTVAAVSGSTAQVQNDQSGQVAVSWTTSTTFTQQVDATLADVTVGSCVMVTTADDDETAATVRITAAADGDSCGFGGGQRPDGAPSGMPTDMPTDMPSDMPSGGPGGARGGGFGTVGEVTAVSATGFTVSATQPGSEDASDVSVTVGDDTTYTTQAKAKATAVTVGRCVTARGDSDDTGAVVATTISVSDPVDGQCSTGFGGGGMRGPEGGAA